MKPLLFLGLLTMWLTTPPASDYDHLYEADPICDLLQADALPAIVKAESVKFQFSTTPANQAKRYKGCSIIFTATDPAEPAILKTEAAIQLSALITPDAAGTQQVLSSFQETLAGQANGSIPTKVLEAIDWSQPFPIIWEGRRATLYLFTHPDKYITIKHNYSLMKADKAEKASRKEKVLAIGKMMLGV